MVVASCSTAQLNHQDNLTSQLTSARPEQAPLPSHNDNADCPLNPQEKDQNALRKQFNEHRLEGGDLDIEVAKMDEDYQDLGETIIVDQTTSQIKGNTADLATVEMPESKMAEE